MTREEATKRIAQLQSEAESKIGEATRLADEHRVGFSFSLAYGMGGTYRPEGGDADEDAWRSSDDWAESSGWVSSSSMC